MRSKGFNMYSTDYQANKEAMLFIPIGSGGIESDTVDTVKSWKSDRLLGEYLIILLEDELSKNNSLNEKMLSCINNIRGCGRNKQLEYIHLIRTEMHRLFDIGDKWDIVYKVILERLIRRYIACELKSRGRQVGYEYDIIVYRDGSLIDMVYTLIILSSFSDSAVFRGNSIVWLYSRGQYMLETRAYMGIISGKIRLHISVDLIK